MKQKGIFQFIYNEKENWFELWFKLGSGNWKFESSYYLVANNGKGEQDFLHWTVLEKIYKLEDLGYKYVGLNQYNVNGEE